MTTVKIRVAFEAEVDLAILRETRRSYPSITPRRNDPTAWSARDLLHLIDEGEDPDKGYPVGNVQGLTIETVPE